MAVQLDMCPDRSQLPASLIPCELLHRHQLFRNGMDRGGCRYSWLRRAQCGAVGLALAASWLGLALLPAGLTQLHTQSASLAQDAQVGRIARLLAKA